MHLVSAETQPDRVAAPTRASRRAAFAAVLLLAVVAVSIGWSRAGAHGAADGSTDPHGGRLGQRSADVAPNRLAGRVDPIAQEGGVTKVIRIDGTIAWMGVGPRLVAMDISDPAAPTVIGRTDPLPGVVGDVAIGDVEPNGAGGDPNVAWVLVGDDLLVSVDIAQPHRPEPIAYLPLDGGARHVAVVGDDVWLDTWDSELLGVDATDPAQPRPHGRVELPLERGNIQAVAATPGHLVLASRPDQTTGGPILRIVDVREPDAPTEVGTVPHPGPRPYGSYGPVYDMVVADGLAWVLVSTDYQSLLAVDLSDPARPVVVGDLMSRELDGYYLAVADGLACVLGGDWGHNWISMSVVDVRDPTAMSVQASRASIEPLDTNPSGGFAVADGHAWLGADDGKLVAMDASDPAAIPEPASTTERVGDVGRLALVGDHALVALPEAVAVLDLSQPDAPRQITQTLVHHYPMDLAVDGRLAVVSTGGAMDVIDSRLHTLDVTRPRAPVEGDSASVAGYGPVGLSTASGLAAIAESRWSANGALKLFTVAPTGTLRAAGTVEPGGGYGDLALRGDLVAAVSPGWRASGAFRLDVIDATDPDAPVILGSEALGGSTGRGARVHLVLADAHAFALTRIGADPEEAVTSTLHVVRIAPPDDPEIVAQLDIPPYVYDMTLDEGYLFLAFDDGVLVVDVRDAASPSTVITLPTSGGAIGVAAADGLVYAGCGQAGLHVFAPDLPERDPWVPTATATPTAAPPWDPRTASPTASPTATASPTSSSTPRPSSRTPTVRPGTTTATPIATDPAPIGRAVVPWVGR